MDILICRPVIIKVINSRKSVGDLQLGPIIHYILQMKAINNYLVFKQLENSTKQMS